MSDSEHFDNSESSQGFTRNGFAELNAKLHKLVDEGKLANIVIVVAHQGKIIHRDAYGVQDVSADPPVPVKTSSLYRLASMVKPFVAVAMMMLWEEEVSDLKVKLKDEGRDITLNQSTSMTMRQLMSHTAGFGATEEYDQKSWREGDLEQPIDVLTTTSLSFQPGTEWRYGPGVEIQSYIVEKLTRQSLDEYLAERLSFGSKLVSVPLKGTYPAKKPKFLGGGMKVYSTVDDYFRFCQMLLNGGEFEGKQYLKESTVKLMKTSVLEPGVTVKYGEKVEPGVGFGLGFALFFDTIRSLNVCAHYWRCLFGNWFLINPKSDMVVVGFVNETAVGRKVGGLTGMCAGLISNALNV